MKKILYLSVLVFSIGCASNDVYTADERVYVSELPKTRATRALSQDEVVAMAKEANGRDAIARLDSHPFNFELTDARLAELEANELSENVMDYLEKRAAIDWDQLHAERLQLQSVEAPQTEAQRIVLQTNSYQPSCGEIYYSRYGFTPVTRSVYRLGRGRQQRFRRGHPWQSTYYRQRRGVFVIRR
ncbi:MAG: hypothetical protein P1V97_06605 [Planctomycetota bacterium]|nr:hypothetical protein [Planctomycetota bacterium]